MSALRGVLRRLPTCLRGEEGGQADNEERGKEKEGPRERSTHSSGASSASWPSNFFVICEAAEAYID